MPVIAPSQARQVPADRQEDATHGQSHNVASARPAQLLAATVDDAMTPSFGHLCCSQYILTPLFSGTTKLAVMASLPHRPHPHQTGQGQASLARMTP